MYSGAAFVAFLVFFLTGLVLTIIGNKDNFTQIVYSGLGALLFSFFLLIDTQMIVGGTRSVQIHPEEYILAVITLYLDILQIFIHILNILNRS